MSSAPFPQADLDAPWLASGVGLGAVHLIVTDLDRSLAFYTQALGLHVHDRTGTDAGVGDAVQASLVLHADASARPAGRHAGLYHVALLYTTRAELSRAAHRLARAGARIDGASDHGTHEAIYLADPDGNGLELAADRARAAWPSVAELIHAGGPAPLDLSDLLDLTAHEPPAPSVAEGLRVGHVHLHVNDLEAATTFYRDVLGLDVTMQLRHAVFLSYGGYHHHIAINVWRGIGIPGVPDHAVGMRRLTLELTVDALASILERIDAAGIATAASTSGVIVMDPAGNGVGLAATGAASADELARP